MENEIGRKIDISNLVDIFEAKEGDVEQIIGKTGQGKTYEATRRALRFLEQGNVVYTTWLLNLPDYFDERDSPFHVLKNIFLLRKNFYRFEYKKNWHFVNLDDYLDVDGVFDTEKFAKFLATRTDCIFMLDEGQDTFDSHQRAGKIARQSITRTRHMHKKLIIISQRAQAVDVNARGNVTWFYKCVASKYPFLPTFFRVYMTDEIDEGNNYPIWVRHDSQGKEIWKADLYYSGFAQKKIYDAYDSWYMRKNMVKSQNVHLHGYKLRFRDKIRLMFRLIRGKKLSTGYPQDKEKKTLPVDSQSGQRVIELGHVNKTVKSDDVPPRKQRVVSAVRVKSYKPKITAQEKPDESDRPRKVQRQEFPIRALIKKSTP